MAVRSTSPDIECPPDMDDHHVEKQRDSSPPTHPTTTNQPPLHIRDLTFTTPVTSLPHHPSLTLPSPHPYSNPFDWSNSRKTVCLILSCTATLIAAYSAGSYSIASDPIRTAFSSPISPTLFQSGVTVWCVGFACSPMVLAPLSELSGRRPVFLFSGLLFFIAQVGCAVTTSFAGMLVARFFVGAGASTFATMVGGVISDVFHAENRNTPMAIYSASALAGTGLGPLVSGFIVANAHWRWVFWHQVIALGTIMALMAVFFKETRGSVLLTRKADHFNKYMIAFDAENEKETTTSPASPTTQQPQSPIISIRYRIPNTPSTPPKLTHLLHASLTTPFKLLTTEPVVFFFSLWASFAWAVLYLCLSILPLVFRTIYTFTTPQVASTFTSLVVGVLLALFLSITQEILAKRYFPKLLSSGPEGRLYFACLESILLPLGLFIFGWTSSPSIPYIVPCLGVATATIGIFSIYLAVFNYLADVYHRYASSALACQSFCRNILAGVFPLFSERLFGNLGVSAASSLLGGVAVVLTVVPWVLVFKGEKIRAASRVAREGM